MMVAVVNVNLHLNTTCQQKEKNREFLLVFPGVIWAKTHSNVKYIIVKHMHEYHTIQIIISSTVQFREIRMNWM